MRAEPYLQLQGRCEEALNFYRDALGAVVEALVRFADAPGAPPGASDKVMHAAFRVGESTLLASDGPSTGRPAFEGFSLALNVADDAEARACFAALADGGETRVPLAPTPFASSFGIVADRFGVPWMVVAAPAVAS